jgi:tRNA(fMet)-specific endonuclease VapC
VSFEEQLRGWLTLMARSRTPEQQIKVYERLRALLKDFQTRPVLDFDVAAAFHYRRLVKARIRIGTMDLRIAAITFARDALLQSRNLSDFRKVPGLRVED